MKNWSQSSPADLDLRAPATPAAPSPARLGSGDAEFLGKVVHELRNSLGGLVARTETLAAGADLLDRGEIQRELDVLAERGERLRRMMERLLDLSQLSARRIDVQPVALAALVRELVEAEQWPNDCEVLLRIDDDLELSTDRVGLEQILTNLLRNAYLHGGFRIEIEGRFLGDHCVIDVIDDGPGVDEAQRETLFRPFVRADGTAPGWGLGLAIVSEVTHLLDGAVRYEPNEPRGARFSVMLPTN